MTLLARLSSAVAAIMLCTSAGFAQMPCPATHEQLAAALKASVKLSGGPGNGGLDNNMWATLVARDGSVCAVAFSGKKWDDQWPGSRIIAAQKAFTANAFSLADVAFSTAQMYSGSQPGGFLFGINNSNPVSTDVANAGDAVEFGTDRDPLVGRRAAGIITFGGGIALYDASGIVGGLGVSGDTSCADHNVAWRVRNKLGLDKMKSGPAGLKTDGIVYDIGLTGTSSSGFGHPKCAAKEDAVAKDIGAGDSSAPK